MKVQEVLEAAGLRDSEDMIATAIADQLAALRQALEQPTPWSPDELDLLRDSGLNPARATRAEVDRWMSEAAETYARLAASSLSVTEAAHVLDVNPSRVRQRLTERSLHGFKVRRQWRVPSWQFSGAREIPGLAQVLPHLPLHDPVSVHEFFANPTPELSVDGEPVAPLQWLSAGRPTARVREIAVALTST